MRIAESDRQQTQDRRYWYASKSTQTPFIRFNRLNSENMAIMLRGTSDMIREKAMWGGWGVMLSSCGCTGTFREYVRVKVYTRINKDHHTRRIVRTEFSVSWVARPG